MDFEENDNGEEEMDIPAYHPPPGNSGRPKQGGAPDLPAGNFPRHSVGGVRYRECLKNHAVGIGGHAVDGCGEFTAAGEEGTIDALRCAACNCHRNFHRKDLEPGGGGDRSGFHSPYSPYYRMPVGYLQYNQMGAATAAATAGQQRFVAHLGLPSTSGGGLSREEHEEVRGGGGGGLGASSSSSGKKRFRTKFTPEQKNKMLAFADRIGWRIQKSDEAEVQQFCEETSIKRHVFKVWMHNNKHNIGKQAIDPSPPPLPLPSESIGH